MQTICRRRAKNAGVDPFEAFAFPEGGKISPYCNDLLQKLMAFYPQKRCTATEVSSHALKLSARVVLDFGSTKSCTTAFPQPSKLKLGTACGV